MLCLSFENNVTLLFSSTPPKIEDDYLHNVAGRSCAQWVLLLPLLLLVAVNGAIKVRRATAMDVTWLCVRRMPDFLIKIITGIVIKSIVISQVISEIILQDHVI